MFDTLCGVALYYNIVLAECKRGFWKSRKCLHSAWTAAGNSVGYLRQYRTKSVWRLCTPSACKFPFRACFVSSRTHLACIFSEIFRENTRKSTKDFLRFSLHLSKNLTTQSAYVRYETDSHISQKCSWIHKVFTALFVSSDEKSDGASDAQSLCGIALKLQNLYDRCSIQTLSSCSYFIIHSNFPHQSQTKAA